MSKVLVNESSLTDIADAIREKNGTEETYKPSEMGDAVRAIESGGESSCLFYLSEYDEEGYPTVLTYNCQDTSTLNGLTGRNGAYNGRILSHIKKVIMPNTVTTIEDSAFVGGASIEELSNWDYITRIEKQAFSIDNNSYGDGGKGESSMGVKYTYLPPNITYIGTNAFRKNMVNISAPLPDTLTYIGDSAFAYGGDSAWEINVLPPNVIYIGASAFQCYRKLLITEIPVSVETLGNYAFDGTYDKNSLTIIKFLGTPTEMGKDIFRNNTKLVNIYVPWSEGEVANAPWGATNATIHYNTTYDENHNPIV